ncbi:STF2 [Candida pseudojiufengensis]|uniref:STF2 n=1 Tax=Candida pseudojiufengensis TaxID=497109 RepID=UPI00222426C9|nr:STF2 [Candida pseudojiufengensis]KAI5960609.1 STF2 [Candida pseudojiufengensis]
MSKTKKWGIHEKSPQESKWFTHNGYSNTNPTKIKKNGAGKNNWGQPGDEIDLKSNKNNNNFNSFNNGNSVGNGRRNSNHDLNEMKFNRLNDAIDSRF